MYREISSHPPFPFFPPSVSLENRHEIQSLSLSLSLSVSLSLSLSLSLALTVSAAVSLGADLQRDRWPSWTGAPLTKGCSPQTSDLVYVLFFFFFFCYTSMQFFVPWLQSVQAVLVIQLFLHVCPAS